MCVGDWRLGKLIRSEGYAFDVALAINLTRAADPNRVGITFETHLASPLINSASLVTFTNGQRILIGAGEQNVHITLATHGDLPTYGFTISQLTANSFGSVILYTLPTEYLAAALQQFQSEYGKAFNPPLR